jgi:thiosulfate reductase / polysulfide reductase chain A
MSLTRRNWLRLTGAGLAGSGSLFGAFEEYFKAGSSSAAAAQKVVTACGLCSPACGIQATVRDGVMEFLEGLPGDLSGAGKLCGKGASAAGFLYDPDRLKYPMKRTNPSKGFDVDPGWVRITWQEALDTIAARLGHYIQQYGAESLLFLTLPGPDVWARFMNAIGVVNRTDHVDECFLTDRVVSRYTIGGKTWCNDFENSKYILLFGWDLVAKSKLVFAKGITDARDKGAKVVCFNPQYTATARFSDEWHPIRPGTDLAVALAMINVIVGENLYDREFVANYTNFAQYENQIREHFQQYTPEWAEKESDVPAEAIRRIAREFGSSGPAIVPAHKKTLCANYANASQLVHAIAILNILAGTIDRPGGRYFARAIAIPGADAIYPPPSYPAKKGRRVDGRDKLPLANEADGGMFSTLADGILNKHPGVIKAAFWNGYTILGFPQPLSLVKALETVEFSVAMDFLPTDTVSLADIVLPSTVYLENSDLVARDYKARYPQVVVRQPVVAPMFETRGMGWVAIELGKRMVPDYFRKPDGQFFTPGELLDEKTRRAGLGNNFAEFRQTRIVTREQPFAPRTTFNVPGGGNKCQIFVPQFEERGYKGLPDWKPKAELPSPEYPYYYLTFIPAVHRRNTTENNAILNEMMPSNAAIMHPSLAARIGVSEGRQVRVRSRVGAIELPAHLSETLRPDCVMVAHGFGHRSKFLTKAGGKGVRDGDPIPARSIDEAVQAGNYGGSSCIMEAVVNVERV